MGNLESDDWDVFGHFHVLGRSAPTLPADAGAVPRLIRRVTGAATLPISWLEGALSDADPVTNLRV